MKPLIILVAAFLFMTSANGSIEPTGTADPYPGISPFSSMNIPLTRAIDQRNIAFEVSNISITPNPVRYNQMARIEYELPVTMNVRIVITNMKGQTFMAENLGKLDAGTYTERLQARELTNGMYNFTFVTDHGRVSTRFVVAR